MTGADTVEPPPPKGTLAFVVTEDWFFASHFLPMIRAARVAGYAVIVITRVRRHRETIEAAGARVVALEAERRSLDPRQVWAAVAELSRILKRESVDAVHCIALRSILVGGLAARRAGVSRRVFAVTGGGFVTARQDRLGRAAAAMLRSFIRRGLEGPDTRYLFENEDDPRALGLDPAAPNVTIVGGAGVDPRHFQALPLPPSPPLRVALVARMLWSKGVDLAVEAVRLARARGSAVELSLFGDPDPSNPRAIDRAQLLRWSAEEGIAWLGFCDDVRTVWRDHHVACLPSRGGEGLPRTLLEAAACGRAIVTTDVPGCRSFVRDGIDGVVVAPGDIEALARALEQLVGDPETVRAMGEDAERRVLSGYTEEMVVARAAQMYLTWGAC